MISRSKLFNFQIKASVYKHLEVAAFFMSIVLLSLCYELRKWNHIPSALQTQARTQIVLCLTLHKLPNWTFISTRANQRYWIQAVWRENWLLDKINIFL